jgi:hypothetical protein
VQIFTSDFKFDGLLCENWPFSPGNNRRTLPIILLSFDLVLWFSISTVQIIRWIPIKVVGLASFPWSPWSFRFLQIKFGRIYGSLTSPNVKHIEFFIFTWLVVVEKFSKCPFAKYAPIQPMSYWQHHDDCTWNYWPFLFWPSCLEFSRALFNAQRCQASLLANLRSSTSRDTYRRSMMEKLQAKEKDWIISGLMCQGKALGDSIPNITGLGQCSSRVRSAPHFWECPHLWVL